MLNINWEVAINTRRSARNYQMSEIDKDKLQELISFSENIEVPFSHNVECRFFKAEPTKKLYFSMQSPPDNLIVSRNTPSSMVQSFA